MSLDVAMSSSDRTEVPTAVRSLPSVAGIAAVVLALDQLTKAWAVSRLSDGPIELFWTLRLVRSSNTGIAFSLVQGLGPLVGIVVVAMVGVLIHLGRTAASRSGVIALGLLLGGALGNLADRLFRSPGLLRGAVVDFIDFQWWPSFNLADAAVVIGGLLLAFGGWKASGHRKPVGPGGLDREGNRS